MLIAQVGDPFVAPHRPHGHPSIRSRGTDFLLLTILRRSRRMPTCHLHAKERNIEKHIHHEGESTRFIFPCFVLFWAALVSVRAGAGARIYILTQPCSYCVCCGFTVPAMNALRGATTPGLMICSADLCHGCFCFRFCIAGWSGLKY